MYFSAGGPVEPGDHILANRTLMLYTHHGIYAGGHTVINFTGEPTNKRGARIRETTITEFKSGYPLLVRRYRAAVFTKEESLILARAISQRSLSGQWANYWLPSNNCEHFATYCRTAIPRSPQVETVEQAFGPLSSPLWLLNTIAQLISPADYVDAPVSCRRALTAQQERELSRTLERRTNETIKYWDRRRRA
jgi:Lecithin retinol acyltransferase